MRNVICSRFWMWIGALGLVAGLAVAEARAADRDLLVSSRYGQSVERFDGATGQHKGAFVPKNSGGLRNALGMAFGPDGNLYVGSSTQVGAPGSIVKRYDAQTEAFIGDFTFGAVMYSPISLAFGPDGNLYVSSWESGGGNVLRYNGTTGAFMDVFIPSGRGGLSQPGYLIFAPGNTLYLGSIGSDSVLRFNATTGDYLDTFVTPQSGGLNAPSGMTFGPDGNLYVAGSTSNNVLRYDGTTGAFIDQFVPGGLDYPVGVIFGPDGNLCVADSNNNRIQRYDGATGEFMDTFASGPELSGPWGMVFMPVFDCNNNGRRDSQDIADGISGDCNGNLIPDECEIGVDVIADFNHDCCVDSGDLTIFVDCAGGPALPYAPGCALVADGQGFIAADFDRDSDVDQSDFGLFQRCYSGPGQLADPDCAN